MVGRLNHLIPSVRRQQARPWKYFLMICRSQRSETGCEHHGPEVRNLWIDKGVSRTFRAYQTVLTSVPLRVHEVHREDPQVRVSPLPQT